jgi:hypothetical protein
VNHHGKTYAKLRYVSHECKCSSLIQVNPWQKNVDKGGKEGGFAPAGPEGKNNPAATQVNSTIRGRNIKGRPFGVDFDRRSLRSDCHQGSRPAARCSARASLRVLDCILAPASILPWGSRRSPFLGCARFRFYEFSLVLEVMPPQKNRSASPVARNFGARIKGRPFVVSFERFLNSLRKERPR